MTTRDPILHSHVEDCLPTDHRLAFEEVLCVICYAQVHAFNNECMQTWVETGKGAYCLPCFVRVTDGAVDDEFGLHP
jgi:hypothetical protein